MASIADAVLSTGQNTVATAKLLTEINNAKLAQVQGDPAKVKEAYRNLLLELENQTLKEKQKASDEIGKRKGEIADLEGELSQLQPMPRSIADYLRATQTGDTERAGNIASGLSLADDPSATHTALARLQGDRMTAANKSRELDQDRDAFDRTGERINAIETLQDPSWTPEMKALMSADINAGTTGLYEGFYDVQEKNIDWVMGQIEKVDRLVESELLSPARGEAFKDKLLNVTSKTKSPAIQLREQLKKDCAEGYLTQKECEDALKTIYGLDDPVTSGAIRQRRNMLDNDLAANVITQKQWKEGVLILHELVKNSSSSPDKIAVMGKLMQKYKRGSDSSKVLNGLTRGLSNPDQFSTVVTRMSRWLGDSQTPSDMPENLRREAAAAIRLEIRAKTPEGEATDKLSDADLKLGRALPELYALMKEIPPGKLGVIERGATELIWRMGRDADPRLARYHAYMTLLVDFILRIQTGAAITPPEVVRKEMNIPNIGNKLDLNVSLFEGLASYVLDMEHLYYEGIVGEAWTKEIVKEHLGKLQGLEVELEARNKKPKVTTTMTDGSGKTLKMINEDEYQKGLKNNESQ